MSRRARHGFDGIDREIVRYLREDGRRSNVWIGRAVGLSERAVRSRIARLEASFGLKITASVRAEGTSHMLYLIKCLPGARFAVAAELQRHAAVEEVYITNGTMDLCVSANFEEDGQALSFQLELLDGHAQIVQYSSSKVVATARHTADAPHATPQVEYGLIGGVLLDGTAKSSPAEYARWLVPHVATIFGAERALVRVEGEPTILAWHNMPTWYQDSIATRLPAEQALGAVFRASVTGQHVFLKDAQESPLLAPISDLITNAGIISVLAIPLRKGERVLGVITLYFTQPVDLDDSYFATLQALADQCALTLDNLVEQASRPDTFGG